MTTRFSIAEMADMLHQPVTVIRSAVESLASQGELTAESFVFGDRNWRLAPSDVKRIQAWIEEQRATGELDVEPPKRIVKRRRVIESDSESPKPD